MRCPSCNKFATYDTSAEPDRAIVGEYGILAAASAAGKPDGAGLIAGKCREIHAATSPFASGMKIPSAAILRWMKSM